MSASKTETASLDCGEQIDHDQERMILHEVVDHLNLAEDDDAGKRT